MWGWFWRFVAWDGILPIVVSVVPSAVVMLFPRNDAAEVLTFILVPIGAALLRCTVGAVQIARICDGDLPVLRQLALGTAIVFLLMFEGCVTMLAFSRDLRDEDWLMALPLYACYLVPAALAFLPRAEKQPDVTIVEFADE